MRQYNKALNKSVKAFIAHVEPLIKDKWQLDYIHRCEGYNNGLEGHMDYKHGCDYLLFKGGRMHGLANRVLFRRDYKNKITLRNKRINLETKEEKPSDYLKYKTAIESNGAYPEYFCGACVIDDKLINCVIVQTVDLIKFIDETNPPLQTNADDDKNQLQEYFTVDWRDMQNQGYKVWILQAA